MKKNEDTPPAKSRTNKVPIDKNRSQNRTSVNKGEHHHTRKNSSRASSTRKKPSEPVRKIEWPAHICEKCGEPIADLTQALSDKSTGKPVHFECILNFLKNSEELKAGEEVLYIGNGNFAVVFFEHPTIRKNFKIVKLIEWEDRSKQYEWQDEIAKLGSST